LIPLQAKKAITSQNIIGKIDLPTLSPAFSGFESSSDKNVNMFMAKRAAKMNTKTPVSAYLPFPAPFDS
jgi:hypothetical protein